MLTYASQKPCLAACLATGLFTPEPIHPMPSYATAAVAVSQSPVTTTVTIKTATHVGVDDEPRQQLSGAEQLDDVDPGRPSAM